MPSRLGRTPLLKKRLKGVRGRRKRKMRPDAVIPLSRPFIDQLIRSGTKIDSRLFPRGRKKPTKKQ